MRDLVMNEAKAAQADHLMEVYGARARTILFNRLMSTGTEPNIDTTFDLLLDDLPAYMGRDWPAFRAALANNDAAAVGRWMIHAAECAARKYIAAPIGQEAIEHIVDELAGLE